MPLINCKVNLELSWTKNFAVYGSDAYDVADNNRETTFKITSTKLYVLIVTLSTKDNVKLTKQLNKRFERSVYWNEYKTKIDLKDLNSNEATDIRIYLDASFQGVKGLFVLAFDNTDDGDKKY